ncbi:helix-turn-helix transcriptional regulator [Bizionia gelidisalsuginis]|uniref:Helix-turn-helix transcriptional regulator n=1 Tax=Bizionia gelidisalsuginis TaxID=291188 RepID=A0ABY3MDR3_9FLAO|nr:helix-turn-helix transcriptional regulator [Bizionia gelidisalsuginis]TYC17142.1 helix-turn-helix transcriptional regulator [Bizionia gelidisalsuginis]
MLPLIENNVTAIVCLISAVIIQRIFIKELRRGTDKEEIEGIKWFGLAIFFWGLGAFINVLCITLFNWETSNKILIYLGVIISLANSLFILLSLQSIEHDSKRSLIVRVVQRFSTREFVGLYCAVLGMIAFVFVAASYSNSAISNNFIWLIDIPISVFVALSLFFELNKAFKSRQMQFMYLPTFALFTLIMIAVLQRIIPQDRVVAIVDQEFWSLMGTITAISFKFLFIFLFSILLYSWKFLSENEQQESQVNRLTAENKALYSKLDHFEIASESHLDTIKTIKKEITGLREAQKTVLSERQKEVLAYLAHYGTTKSYGEIAEIMNISVDGFQTHIYQVKKILNISGNAGKEQLITYALVQNLRINLDQNPAT